MNVSSGPGGGGGLRGKPSSASSGNGDGTAGLDGSDSVRMLLADAVVAADGGWSS